MRSKTSRPRAKLAEHGCIVEVDHWSVDHRRVERRLAVPPRTTLDRLAEMIRAAFGWEPGHLHEFVISEQHYGLPETPTLGPLPGPAVIDSREMLVSSFTDSCVEFTYDLARGLEHNVRITRSGDVEQPTCLLASCHELRMSTAEAVEVDLASITDAIRQALKQRRAIPDSVALAERCAGLWRECYEGWSGVERQFGPGFLLPRFVEVPVPSPEDGRQIGDHIVDWWPSAVVPARRRHLERNGVFMIPWRTLGGTFQTCEMLWRAREDAETSAAVFVAAFLWDILRDDVPRTWRGARYVLMSRLMSGVRGVLTNREIPEWHHRHREALPVRLIDDESAGMIQPRGARDLGHLAALSAVLAQSTWQLVHVYHAPIGLRVIDH